MTSLLLAGQCDSKSIQLIMQDQVQVVHGEHHSLGLTLHAAASAFEAHMPY